MNHSEGNYCVGLFSTISCKRYDFCCSDDYGSMSYLNSYRVKSELKIMKLLKVQITASSCFFNLMNLAHKQSSVVGIMTL